MNNPIQSTELPKQTVQQVMSQLNSGLMVIDTLLLRGRENFSEWKDWMTGMFSSCVLATEIAAYLSEKELSITFTDQQALSHKLRELILKCMKPDVQSLFTHYSSGVETWKAVETKYAIASSRDAVGYLKYLFGRLADPTITTEAGFLIAEKLTAFMTKYDNDSMKALLFLYGTGNSKVRDLFFSQVRSTPTVTADEVLNFFAYHDELSPPATSSALSVSSSSQSAYALTSLSSPSGPVTRNLIKAKGTDSIWQLDCYNCYGCGHMAKNCPAPYREGEVPRMASRFGPGGPGKHRRKHGSRPKPAAHYALTDDASTFGFDQPGAYYAHLAHYTHYALLASSSSASFIF
ncbi:hypothetical protein G9P44_002648 [Scheffersomyces stipitis]|nr:hypothetical protein G9P44_005726 [Scheffersomyces stipitis]KAG2734642.1 hypothetical protein G9P44_002648 [Scheffersomyces stipitis]